MEQTKPFEKGPSYDLNNPGRIVRGVIFDLAMTYMLDRILWDCDDSERVGDGRPKLYFGESVMQLVGHTSTWLTDPEEEL
jgi:hypothetical protein